MMMAMMMKRVVVVVVVQVHDLVLVVVQGHVFEKGEKREETKKMEMIMIWRKLRMTRKMMRRGEETLEMT
jgi:hypothetical protein